MSRWISSRAEKIEERYNENHGADGKFGSGGYSGGGSAKQGSRPASGYAKTGGERRTPSAKAADRLTDKVNAAGSTAAHEELASTLQQAAGKLDKSSWSAASTKLVGAYSQSRTLFGMDHPITTGIAKIRGELSGDN